MSNRDDQLIGQAIAAVILLPFQMIGSVNTALRRRAAKQRALEAQHKVEQQRKAWLELVQRQQVRGTAGDASQADARAALSGRGGKPNPLDERWFE